MTRILFAHPYHLVLDPHEHGLMKPYAPLSPLVAAANARQAGFDVYFYDGMFRPDESGFAEVVRGYDQVAILGDDHSVQMKMCLSRIKQAHLSMIRAAKEAGAEVLAAGPDVSDHPEDYIEAGANAAAVGDVVDVAVEWLRGDTDIAGLHGERGAGGRRSVVGDLDRLPSPAWDLVDLSEYRDRWMDRHGYWEMNIWTARGCPYRCNWCAKPTWGRTYNVRSPKVVAAEMAELDRLVGLDRIWFTDDIFALKASWLRAFRDAIERPIPYRCLSRVDLMKDPAFTADLAATGCREVWVGAESGSDKILTAMDKDSTVAEIRRATQLLHDHGIRIGFFLQLGYPGEKLDDVLSTVHMVKELRPDEIGVSVSYPLPGTKFHERVAPSMTDAHWGSSMENRPLYEAPFDRAFYGAAKEVLRSVHSASQRRQCLHAFLEHPGRRTARRVAGAAWHSVRLPLVTRRMKRLARPNPSAVPLDW